MGLGQKREAGLRWRMPHSPKHFLDKKDAEAEHLSL